MRTDAQVLPPVVRLRTLQISDSLGRVTSSGVERHPSLIDFHEVVL